MKGYSSSAWQVFPRPSPAQWVGQVYVGKKGLGRDRLMALDQMWASNAEAPFCSDGESELEFR